MKRKTAKKWYNPQTHTGWEKDMPVRERRELAYKAHGRDYLAAGRGMQALANVTTDQPTKIEAQKDAEYFFRKHDETGK